jgi:hypothetical protein
MPDIVSARDHLFDDLMTQAWPPRLKSVDRCVIPGAPRVRFGAADRRAAVETVLADPDVQPWLAGRFEVLGCHRVYCRSDAPKEPLRLRVCLFNYAQSQLVDVYLENGVVVERRCGEPWQHPASAAEVAQAIQIARAHPDLRSAVAKLDGHAILRVPDEPHQPSYRHRCMHVMFTKRDDVRIEHPVLYAAFVDMHMQRVIAYTREACAAC